ncbi:MAG: anaerobic sulfatase maturase [Chloroflexi bacterium]|nr:anaerobic sulfatase maturase [Chloroflexota bacterium]
MPGLKDVSTAPFPFHIMTKPRGAICNLDCKYCYFLKKESLFPGSNFRMSDPVLEEYIQQYICAQPHPEVSFAWQGGEPTLMGLDFFRKAVALQAKYRRPGMRILNSLQTNAITLDEEWCRFFGEHQFLIGVSLDGPQELHDHYRVDKGGAPSFQRVMQGIQLLQQHDVSFNILTTVHAANEDHPIRVYEFLRDEVAARYLQFIPIVERENATGYQEGHVVTDRSVTATKYGEFLIAIFDQWVRNDVGRVFVQIFDVALAAWTGNPAGLCVFEETCGRALAIEHEGSVYSCDHYVEPNYHLGNIMDVPLAEIVVGADQRQFGEAKRDALPQYCLDCEVRFVCNGGCPKNRIIQTPAGEAGLNYLCEGYRAFFNHIDEPMQIMAQLLREEKPPALVMSQMPGLERRKNNRYPHTGRNETCPCGSGIKYKKCCGRLRSN